MNIEDIVKNRLCTGCGICISEDESKTAKMDWNNEGFLVPVLSGKSTQEKMIKVCPFYEKQKNEDVLGEFFLKNEYTSYDENLGHYKNLYAGYSNDFRVTSSSGGLATYIFKELLDNNIVDYLFIVREIDGEYCYQLVNKDDDIRVLSKTRYTPVTLEKLFDHLEKIDGKVAVSGVACFVKALRLKQYYNQSLKLKIPFIVGIICGGLKSKYYTDFLAQSAGCHTEYSDAEYRVKNELSNAIDYKFSCVEKTSKKIHMVEMRSLGDMWGTGLFKSNACDFCDDVVTELADISLGDAWIQPYNNDGLGNSIIITRSKLATEIIENGINNKKLTLNSLNKSLVIKSQQGSFNHRHNGLKFRIKKNKSSQLLFPLKRERFLKNQNIFLNKIQSLRMKIRQKSIETWVENPNVEYFKSAMDKDINTLRIYSAVNRKLTSLLAYLRSFK